ncbi:MAG TPA: glycine cleavage system protein H [Candidatus Binatia bacterium]|nr:glycine cleavage system protein H [Candidatus Binatia bacterium]
MEPLVHDPFASKGIEYLICLAFLGSLPGYWRHLNRPAPLGAETAEEPVLSGWFHLPARASFHAGHAWAAPAGPGRFRVGLDDFAQKLLGSPALVMLPAVGSHLSRGEQGFALNVGGRQFDLPAPLAGRVVARNEAALRDPALLSDPYGAGWLLEVRPSRWSSGLSSLMQGRSAREWLGRAEEALRLRMSPDVGAVLQDGGVPVAGIARALDEEGWEKLARELLARG